MYQKPERQHPSTPENHGPGFLGRDWKRVDLVQRLEAGIRVGIAMGLFWIGLIVDCLGFVG